MKEKLTVKEMANYAFHVVTTETYRPVYAVDIGGEQHFAEFNERIAYKANGPENVQAVWTYFDTDTKVAVVVNKTGVYKLRGIISKKAMEVSNLEITKLEDRISRAIKSLLEMNKEDEPVVRVKLGRSKEINDIVMKKLMVPFYTRQLDFSVSANGAGYWVDLSYKDAKQEEQVIDLESNESSEEEKNHDDCVIDFDRLRKNC